MADQHRGECMGCDGNRAIRTPNMDALAREGVRFRNAYTATPSCIPARAGLLTGLSPWNHGLLGMDGWPIATKYRHEMPRELGKAGYYTATIGKNHFDAPRQSHGYDLMLNDEHHDIPDIYHSDYHSFFWQNAPNIKGPSATEAFSEVVDGCGFGWKDFWNAYQGKAFPYPERLHRTRWVGRSAVNFLRTYDRRQPFFLKVSFIPPHSPYIPPERLMRQYMDADLPEAFHGEWSGKYRKPSGPGLDIWCGDLGKEQVHRSRAGYYGQVAYVDEQIGQMLEELDSRGMMEDTLDRLHLRPRRHAGRPLHVAQVPALSVVGANPHADALAQRTGERRARARCRPAHRAARHDGNLPRRGRGARTHRR